MTDGLENLRFKDSMLNGLVLFMPLCFNKFTLRQYHKISYL